ncbi:magnesium transporter CorA family protein [Diaphorobacter sp. HDW4A]|uniref:magnesium transporter CorA family protein n=1 Tax=Diaphorobacter sp. HDW4A TaxID=2714924 RepID=UPI001408DFE1|nr:magnesium transporter CorA family protein [Diaphorobacter sp. HDW4A]QIL82222.1 magnesium transporter CorA family protein [Diaphorobacter sp. HDW4A]
MGVAHFLPEPPLSEQNPAAFRVFHVRPGVPAHELFELPTAAPEAGFFWIACTRTFLSEHLQRVQTTLQAVTGQQIVDLHVSDLLNAQLPSHYDYTSQYDMLVFRRLAMNGKQLITSAASDPQDQQGEAPSAAPALRRIRTSAVGFVVFDQLLFSVHPDDCTVRDAYATRLLALKTNGVTNAATASPVVDAPISNLPQETKQRDLRAGPITAPRMPTSPADVMLRVVNLIVDGYLDLRRDLSRQLDHWQVELLRPKARGINWTALLESRLALHQLDEICEDQRTAVQDWIDAVEGWPLPETAAAMREIELLKVRSRDVLEHIERVVHHVRRLEQSAETAVQMHFSLQSNRTNDIMRTLTALTAVFLPLNLIAGIFGMNFEFIPFLHVKQGFWWALGTMALIAVALTLLFWRKRYLARTGQS